MEKRGQATVFAIVGVVLVIIVMLVYFLNDQGFVPLSGTQNFLSGKMEPIKDKITECANDGVRDGMEIFGKQGGDFTPGNGLKYKGYNVKYYCGYLEGSCQNNMPLLSSAESSFEEYVINHMKGCVGEGVFQGGLGYEITKGEMEVDVSLNGDGVKVNTDYNVVISKGDDKLSMPKTKVTVTDVPFEDLYGVATDIIETLATGNKFEQVGYMIDHRGEVMIDVDKPYPHVVYMLSKQDSNFELWFAVEGKGEYIL